MQFKVYTDYAVRTVAYLAAEERLISSTELSEKLVIPHSMIFKIGKTLKDHGIIAIATGIRGGFILKKSPEEISLFDIIKLFEPTMNINRCMEADECCSRHAINDCPVRKVYCVIQEHLISDLKSVTIKELARGLIETSSDTD